MSIELIDGTGGSSRVKINSLNELHTYSITLSEEAAANRQGDAYNINTGIISLSSADETPILYLKNNEERNLIVVGEVLGLETSNGTATEFAYGTVIKNPTAGTIVSNATAADIVSNRNYGSSKVLDADVYKGATGNTMTGGSDHLLIGSPDFARVFATINEVVPQGKSIGVTVTPPSSNTAMDVYVALIVYLEQAGR